jgi:hypothetical protein
MLRVIRAPWYVRVFLLMLVVISARAAHGQTSAVTYQGQLSDAGALANGSYDLRFALFDTAAGGAQIGANQTVPAVPVSAGVFTVQLDFGVNVFPGANRFVEIGVKPASGGSFTTLAPRQQIGSSPYAIRTLSAATADALSGACVGCVQDAQIQGVAGSKVSGAIPVASLPAGSANYIQNTTTPQAGINFNVGGNGTIGGMLGIGTSTPASELAVQTATGLYGFTHTDGTITVGSYVGGSSSGATGGWLGTRSNHQLHLFTNNGQPSLTIDTTDNVGIGTTTPQARLHVKGDTVIEGQVGIGVVPNSFSGSLEVAGSLVLDFLNGGGDVALCRNSFHALATCGSSLRYKRQIAPYNAGLELINRLRPISFAWKANGARDLGLGAEDVAKVEPLLVTRNDKGEIEGVKYDHLNVVLINAIKEQQRQIEALQAATTALNARLRAFEKGIENSNGGMNDFMRSN